jgi:hypothetical protein
LLYARQFRVLHEPGSDDEGGGDGRLPPHGRNAARASASARVILASPSKVRTFCSRKSSAPRRMSLSPLPSVLPSAFAAPSRKFP